MCRVCGCTTALIWVLSHLQWHFATTQSSLDVYKRQSRLNLKDECLETHQPAPEYGPGCFAIFTGACGETCIQIVLQKVSWSFDLIGKKEEGEQFWATVLVKILSLSLCPIGQTSPVWVKIALPESASSISFVQIFKWRLNMIPNSAWTTAVCLRGL